MSLIEPLGQPPQPLVFLIGLGAAGAFIAAGVLYDRIVDRRRTREYAQFCLERGFRFEHDRPGEAERHVATCPLFGEGHGRSWGHTISGTRGGLPFTAFEYRWTTGHGRGARRHVIGALHWTLERSLPQFVLTPEGFRDKVAALFGGQDIDFADSADFSRAYRLRGGDEAAVRSLFTPALRHRLVAEPDQHAAGGGRELLWWRPGRLPPPDGLDQLFMKGDRARQLFAGD